MWEIFEVKSKEEAELLIKALKFLITDFDNIEELDNIEDLIERLS